MLRALLESLGCIVLCHFPGTPNDFLKIIAQTHDVPRYLILDGHGIEQGICFGSYMPQIDTSMLRDECLPPEVIEQHARLAGCTIVGSFCWSGTPAMTQAFLAGGASAYLGCEVEPDAGAMNVFLVNFFFNLLHKKLPEPEACRHAVEATDEASIRQII